MEKLNLSSIDSHPKDAIQFFKVMMRFEYALKERGFLQSNNKGRISVDWERYANEGLGPEFFLKIRDQKLAETLLKNPPSHQQHDTVGELVFRQAGNPSNIQDLLAAVLRVRNNLFHGGKSGDVDRDRNDVLIAEALNLIFEALMADQELKQYFEGLY